MGERVYLDFACNDPDNGLFAGRIEQIAGPDLLFELELRSSTAPKLVDLEDAIRVSGKRWAILGSKDWVGNWCWCRYWFAPEVAARLLGWFHSRRVFHCGMAEERLFNRWRVERPFDARDLEFVERQLVKAVLAAKR